MTTDLTIRVLEAQPDDVAVYRAIRARALECDAENFIETLAVFQSLPPEVIAARVADRRNFVAFQQDEPRAIAAWRAEPYACESHRGSLFSVFVDPSLRGAGVARRLVECIIDDARGKISQLELSVRDGNDRALRLYEKLGFQRYGLLPNAVCQDGVFHDDILMVKALSA